MNLLKWIGGPFAALLLSGPVGAQQLSGVWQGVEVNPGKTGVWPTVLTLANARNAAVMGVLYEEGGDNPDFTGTFQVRGAITGNNLRLEHAGLLRETVPEGMGWCQGTILFTYDAAEEKLSGQATYRPTDGCTRGVFTLYRVKLKSPAVVSTTTASTLRVSGQQVRWYADEALRKPVATGNTYTTRLTKTTTFYLTQGFYPTSRPPVFAVTVQVKAAAPQPVAKPAPPPKPVAKPAARPAPKPAPVAAPPAPVVLPTVLFRTTTAELLPESGPALDQLAATLRTRPELRLLIAGHTDRIGEADKNQVLSEQRALAVKTRLVEAGIATDRIETVGYGHSRLLYPAPDARNRRVEIQELP